MLFVKTLNLSVCVHNSDYIILFFAFLYAETLRHKYRSAQASVNIHSAVSTCACAVCVNVQ